MFQLMGSQRVRHDWVNELNWTEFLWAKNLQVTWLGVGQGFSWDCSLLKAWLRKDLIPSSFIQFLTGPRRSTSKLTHSGIFTVLSHDMAAGSSWNWGIQDRHTEREHTMRKSQSFYNLMWHRHFCHTLFLWGFQLKFISSWRYSIMNRYKKGGFFSLNSLCLPKSRASK